MDKILELFHNCWGQAKASPEYDKRKWMSLQEMINELWRSGMSNKG